MTDTLAAIHGRKTPPADVLAMLIDAGAKLAARQALLKVGQDVSKAIDAAERAAVADSTDVLFTALAPRVTELGQQLAAAVDIIGAQPDHIGVGRMGPGAQAAFGRFNEAINGLQRVVGVVVPVFLSRGVPVLSIPRSTWVQLDDDLGPADADRMNETTDFVQLVAAGFTIGLTHPDATKAFRKRIQEMRDDAEREMEAASRR